MATNAGSKAALFVCFAIVYTPSASFCVPFGAKMAHFFFIKKKDARMPQDQALPTVEKGEALDAWLKRAVPVLMEQHGLDEQTATDLATQAWNQINGDAAGGEQPAAEDTAKPGAKPPAPKAKEAAADGTDKPADAAAYGQPAPNAAAGDGKDQPAAEGKKPPFPPKKKDAPAEGKNPDVAQQLTGKPPKAAATIPEPFTRRVGRTPRPLNAKRAPPSSSA
jgi:hypothetical protein